MAYASFTKPTALKGRADVRRDKCKKLSETQTAGRESGERLIGNVPGPKLARLRGLVRHYQPTKSRKKAAGEQNRECPVPTVREEGRRIA